MLQPRLDVFLGVGAAGRGRDRAAERDADLNDREATLHAAFHLDRRVRAAAALLGQSLEPFRFDGCQRQFISREQGGQQQHDGNNQKLDQTLSPRSISSVHNRGQLERIDHIRRR